jgi:hypothetical protein
MMHNTAPSRSLARRSRAFLVIGFMVASGGVFLTALGLFLRIVPTFFGQGTAAGDIQNGIGITLLVVGVIAFLAGVGLAVRALTRRRENDIANVAGEHLKTHFDERYHFIRNINQPKLGYIDAVMVGPPGILVFRILDITGELLNQKGGWVKKNRHGEMTPMRVNPTREAVVDVKAVREFLEKHRLMDLDVYGVVVFVQEPPALVFRADDPVVPVAHLSGLIDALKSNYLAKERLEPELIQRIYGLLFGET